ncbi:hypothetical protein IIB79_05105 [candidate division KSB1 bacterium]|nr:hypothetical protein [candidate division KSB1 bacterium]
MNEPTKQVDTDTAALPVIRKFLLILFLLGTVGAGSELLLIEHTEEKFQLIPLALMGLSLVVVIWFVVGKGPASLRVFQQTMILFIMSGFTGQWLHYKANTEFELEMYPTLGGLDLFWEAIKGSTPPTLAPGTMILLGLLGLAFTYKHPVLSAISKRKQKP